LLHALVLVAVQRRRRTGGDADRLGSGPARLVWPELLNRTGVMNQFDGLVKRLFNTTLSLSSDETHGARMLLVAVLMVAVGVVVSLITRPTDVKVLDGFFATPGLFSFSGTRVAALGKHLQGVGIDRADACLVVVGHDRGLQPHGWDRQAPARLAGAGSGVPGRVCDLAMADDPTHQRRFCGDERAAGVAGNEQAKPEPAQSR